MPDRDRLPDGTRRSGRNAGEYTIRPPKVGKKAALQADTSDVLPARVGWNSDEVGRAYDPSGAHEALIHRSGADNWLPVRFALTHPGSKTIKRTQRILVK